MQPGCLPELLAQAMHIKLVVVAAPDGDVVGPSVDVHCMGQGVIATSSLHHLQRSAAYKEQYIGSMRSRNVVTPLCNLQTSFLLRLATMHCVSMFTVFNQTIMLSFTAAYWELQGSTERVIVCTLMRSLAAWVMSLSANT